MRSREVMQKFRKDRLADFYCCFYAKIALCLENKNGRFIEDLWPIFQGVCLVLAVTPPLEVGKK